jgi:hypothetical protein
LVTFDIRPGGCLFSADIARPKSRISNHVMADFGIDFGIFGSMRKEAKADSSQV